MKSYPTVIWRWLLTVALASFALVLLPSEAVGQDPPVVEESVDVSSIAPTAEVVDTSTDATTPSTGGEKFVLPPAAQNAVLSVFMKLASDYPWFATLLAFMAMARAWAKPVSSLIHTVVDLTPSKADDSILNSMLSFFQTNSIGRTMAYLLDWVTSIKIVPPSNK